MSERLDFGSPCRLQKESDEPVWRTFDEAGTAIFHPSKRAILRVLAARSEESIVFGEIKRLVASYRNGRELATSSVAVFLNELRGFALVNKEEGQWAITEQGLGFLALYDRAREVLSDPLMAGIKERISQMLPESERH